MKKTKWLIALALLCAANFASATLLTFGTTGTISRGDDGLGIFGAAGKNLKNLPFSVSMSVEMDERGRFLSDPLRYSQFITKVPYDLAVTVDGHTYSFKVSDNANSTIFVENAYSTNNGTSDSLSSAAEGYDAQGRHLLLRQSLITFGIRSNSLTQYLQMMSYSNTRVEFEFGSGSTFTTLYTTGPTTFTLNGEPVHAVPEPASAIVFGSGLLMLATIRRRKIRH